jgi:hypothetical protein
MNPFVDPVLRWFALPAMGLFLWIALDPKNAFSRVLGADTDRAAGKSKRFLLVQVASIVIVTGLVCLLYEAIAGY